MNQEKTPIIRENIERIPLKERDEFQRKLIQKMLGPDFYQMEIRDRRETEIAWTDKYSTKVSEIIDNTKNKEIRELIMRGEYERAIGMVVEMVEG